MVESTTERATRAREHAAEVSAVWADAHRRALDELTDLSVGAAEEGAGPRNHPPPGVRRPDSAPAVPDHAQLTLQLHEAPGQRITLGA